MGRSVRRSHMVVSLDLLKPSLAHVVADRVDGSKTVMTLIIFYCWSRTDTHVQYNTQPQTQLRRYLLPLPASTLSTLPAFFQLFGRIGIGIRCHSL